jgi:hypothetical protein
LAIVPVDKTEQDLVDEQIDERILNILGLQDVFDIDYGTYVSLLRERVAAARMTDTQMSTDETELVTDEFKRVRGKTGRFKIKKKKVNIENVVGTKPKEKTTQLDPKKLLPGTAEAPEKKMEDIAEEQKDESKELRKFLMGDLFEAVQSINTSLNEILSLMQKQSKLDKKTSEKDRIEGQKQSKKKREGELESGVDKNSEKLLDKVVKPFTSLFDMIKNFLLNVLLGSAAMWLLDIIKNPKKLLIPIQKLINGIYDFFNGFVKWIDTNLIQPIRNFIDTINDGIKGFVNQLNNALKFIPGAPQVDSPQLPNIPEAPVFEAPDIVGEPVDQMKSGGLVQPRINPMKDERLSIAPTIKQYSGSGLTISPTIKQYSGGGLTIAPKITTIKQYSGGGRNGGSSFSGYVDKNTGTTVGGLGQDTQLTALRKGEFVLVPGAAEELGVDNLMEANKRHGGTNKPRTTTVNNMRVKAAAGGGPINPFPEGSYKGQPGQRYGDPRSYGGHAGIDITENHPYKQDPKRPIYAIKGGKVLGERYQRSGYTSGLMIDHGDGFQARYLHMTPFAKVGDTVRAGQQIGKLIDLGNQTHLHLEYYQGSKRLNPLALLRGTKTGDYIASEDRGTDADSPSYGETTSTPSPPPPTIYMADIRGAANQKAAPSAPSPKTPSVVPFPIPQASGGDQANSGSSVASPAQIPKFPSVDNSNLSVVAASSILQVGGN